MAEGPDKPQSLTVRAEPAALGEIAQYVVAAANRTGLDPRAAYRLRLAVDELATNIITHGYDDSQRIRHTITVRLEPAGDDGCTCVLEDTAPPFNPLEVDIRDPFENIPLEHRPEGGLGLFLARRSVDHFHYERDGDINRNALTVHRTEDPTLVHNEADRRRDRRYAHICFQTHELNAWYALWETVHHSGFGLTIVPDCKQLLRTLHVRGVGGTSREVSESGPPVDIVLLDWLSPDAAQCLSNLKRDARTRTVWTVVLLAGGDEEAAAVAFNQGADDVFVADLPSSVALRRIDHAAERLRLVRERHQARLRARDLERVADTFTEIIVPLGVRLSEERGLDELMERVVMEAMAICHADGGTYYAKGDDLLQWQVMRTLSAGLAYGGPHGKEMPYPPIPLHEHTNDPNMTHLASRVALTGEPLHVPDVYGELNVDVSGAKDFDERTGYRTVSCLTVPVKAGNRVLGVLQLLNAQSAETHRITGFSAYHQVMVESLASQAAIAIYNRRMQDKQQALQAAEQELEVGRQIQSSFLPNQLPRLIDWEIAVEFQPARTVSGDFYDVFPLTPDGCLGVVIADVCDKGAGAAIFMALTRSLLRAFSQRGWTTHTTRPAVSGQTQTFLIVSGDVPTLTRMLRTGVTLTNDYIASTHAELNMFATVFFGILVPDTGKFLYINAGHPAPLILQSDGGIRERLRRTGPAVGVIQNAKYNVEEVDIAPGELLLGYTDGVTDAVGPYGNRFGRSGVETLVSTLPAGETGAEALLAHVKEGVEHHVKGGSQYDDIAMIALKRKP